MKIGNFYESRISMKAYKTVCPFCEATAEKPYTEEAKIYVDKKTSERIMYCERCGYYQSYNYRKNTMVTREKVWRQTRI